MHLIYLGTILKNFSLAQWCTCSSLAQFKRTGS